MRFHMTSYNLFLFAMAMFFPSLIYAPWTEADPPTTPPNDMKNDCAHWIEFNGFKLTDYPHNRDKAVSRDVTKDMFASKWAAIYALKIGGIRDIYQNLLPQDFCNSFGNGNRDQMTFQALGDAYLTCKGFLELYTFKENHTANYTFIMNIDPSKVKYISIWAYVYWKLIHQFGLSYSLTPSELCSKMGTHNERGSLFKPVDGTLLTCRDWIDLYDLLSFNPVYALEKARNLAAVLSEYPIHVQYFARKYARDLKWMNRNYGLVVDLHYGRVIGQPLHELSSLEFCRQFNGNGTEHIKYEFLYGGPYVLL